MWSNKVIQFKVGDIVKYNEEYILAAYDGILPRWYNSKLRFTIRDENYDRMSNVTVYHKSKSSSNIYIKQVWWGFLKLDISYIRKTKLERILVCKEYEIEEDR